MRMVRKDFIGEVKNMRFGNYGRRNFFDLMDDGRCGAVSRHTYKLPEIKPSKSGAIAGAAAGGAVGGPIGAAVGAVFGFIFGPAD